MAVVACGAYTSLFGRCFNNTVRLEYYTSFSGDSFVSASLPEVLLTILGVFYMLWFIITWFDLVACFSCFLVLGCVFS